MVRRMSRMPGEPRNWEKNLIFLIIGAVVLLASISLIKRA